MLPGALIFDVTGEQAHPRTRTAALARRRAVGCAYHRVPSYRAYHCVPC